VTASVEEGRGAGGREADCARNTRESSRRLVARIGCEVANVCDAIVRSATCQTLLHATWDG
jgi:hypothetical protein